MTAHAMVHGLVGTVLATTTTAKPTTSSGSSVFLIVMVALVLGGYFLFLRPQQQKARRQRQQMSTVSVGDQVVTVGGVVGTVLEVSGDRILLETGGIGEGGGVGDLGGFGGTEVPTRIVFVRQAIARKLENPAPSADEVGDGGQDATGSAGGHDVPDTGDQVGGDDDGDSDDGAPGSASGGPRA